MTRFSLLSEGAGEEKDLPPNLPDRVNECTLLSGIPLLPQNKLEIQLKKEF
jgi:hypothetical protein